MQYSKIKLSQGSSLGIISIPGAYPITVSAYVNAGFRHDPPDKPGLAHFAEHLITSRTKKHKTARDLAWAIEKYGGWHDAFTWVEYQYHLIHLPKEKAETGVRILLETLTCPLINQETISKEKKIIKEEVLRNQTNSEKAVWDYSWNPLFFENTSLARPYSGTEQDVENIKVSDVDKFAKETFLANHTTFFLAGDIDKGKAVDLFEKHVKNYDRQESLVKPDEVSKGKSRVKVFPHKTDQAAVVCGMRTVPMSHRDSYALKVAREILGGFFGARLPQKLRDEKGLIYTWNMWLDLLEDTGYLVISTSTASKNIYDLVQRVREEFLKLAQRRIHQDEFENAKGHLCGATLTNTQTTIDFTNWYGYREAVGRQAISPEEEVEIYKKVAKEDVWEVAKKYFREENFYVAIAGQADEEKLKSSLF